jgi:antibiotic biosynthesis monooxygenase (ABM) superfamily enzyme
MTQMTMNEMALTATTMSEAAERMVPAVTPAPAASRPAGPSIHRRVLLTWVAVYPTITILQSLLGTKVAAYPLPVRTLVLTVLMAPLMTYLVLPAVMKAHAKVVAGRRISG